MSEDVLRFYQLADVCRERTAQARQSRRRGAVAKACWGLARIRTSRPATARLRAALHPMNSDQKIWPLEHLHQLVQDDALVIPGPRF